jgi:hypothetical protein
MLLPQFAGFRDDFGNRFQDIKDELPSSLFFREYPLEIEYQFQRTVGVSATRGLTYTIKISGPMDLTTGSAWMQDDLGMQQSKSPTTMVPIPYLSENGQSDSNDMYIWEDSIDMGSDSLSVTYHIKTKTTIWDRQLLDSALLDSTPSGPVDDLDPNWKTTYNRDEWRIDDNSDGQMIPSSEDDIDGDGKWDYRIEPTDPQISSLSSQLTSGKATVYNKARAIYEYLISDDVLDYETIRGSGLPKACITTLSDKSGDCDDYSILYISLCRAADIPARLHLGVLYDPQNDQWIGHGWAEVYIPLKSGGEILGTVDVVNKQFLFRDPYHITDWVDTGGTVTEDGEVKDNLDYYYYSFTYIGSGKKDSDGYQTLVYDPSQNKEKIPITETERTGTPSDGDDAGSQLCFLPGFETYLTLIAISVTVFIMGITRGKILR